jgi:hypothetical protein
MGKFRNYWKLEKEVIKNHGRVYENRVTLSPEDFSDGKLTMRGYIKLKEECDYIPASEQIEIVIPKGQAAEFRNSLGALAADELRHIKNDKRETYLAGLVCFLLGVLILVCRHFVLDSAQFSSEVLLIASWAFTWTAVTKFFFEQWHLRRVRLNILQLLCGVAIEK